jgi:hypothetical protein
MRSTVHRHRADKNNLLAGSPLNPQKLYFVPTVAFIAIATLFPVASGAGTIILNTLTI